MSESMRYESEVKSDIMDAMYKDIGPAITRIARKHQVRYDRVAYLVGNLILATPIANPNLDREVARRIERDKVRGEDA